MAHRARSLQLAPANSVSPTTQSEREPKLLDQVRSTIRARHYSIRTEEAYVGWITRFILFHDKRHPREMAEAEIHKFLIHLVVERNAASVAVARCALL